MLTEYQPEYYSVFRLQGIVPIQAKTFNSSRVSFILNSPFEDENLGNRLYSISYAWGTISLGHRKKVSIEEEGKIVNKSTTVYIIYEPGSSYSIIAYNQFSNDNPLPSRSEFEYIVDQTIRLQKSKICITETEGDSLFAATCSEDSTR